LEDADSLKNNSKDKIALLPPYFSLLLETTIFILDLTTSSSSLTLQSQSPTTKCRKLTTSTTEAHKS
jgi:hypothetical protein